MFMNHLGYMPPSFCHDLLLLRCGFHKVIVMQEMASLGFLT